MVDSLVQSARNALEKEDMAAAVAAKKCLGHSIRRLDRKDLIPAYEEICRGIGVLKEQQRAIAAGKSKK